MLIETVHIIYQHQFLRDSERAIIDGAKPELAAHAVYVSGIGVDRRYKDGDPDFRNCDACATGPAGSFSYSDRQWYIDNPGKFRPGCICVVETPYIEIKNSWGSDWGDDGYLKIALDYIKDENIVSIPLQGGLSGLCSALCSGPQSRDKNSNRFSFIGLRPVNCRRGGEGKSDESVDTSKVGVSKGAGKRKRRRKTKRMKRKERNENEKEKDKKKKDEKEQDEKNNLLVK